MTHPALPRDLDVSILRKHVLQHTPAGCAAPLSYFPLPVLTFVTLVAGNSASKRLEYARECGDMLRFRSSQLSIPLEQLMKSAGSAWSQPAPAGAASPQPAESEYVTHRGFLEVLAFWLNKFVLSVGGSVSAEGNATADPFLRLKKYVQYQSQIGEILFGVAMPAPAASVAVAAASAAATASAVAASAQRAAITVAAAAPPAAAATASTGPAGFPTAAFTVPPPPPRATPVRASLPPAGVKTIQDEIEAAQLAAIAFAATRAAADADADAAEAMSDAASAAAPAAAAASASASSSSGFSIPAGGIPVLATRFDGKDTHALVGRLVAILPGVTLASAMPSGRNEAQVLPASKVLEGPASAAQCTVEEYWAERGLFYGAEQVLRDPASPLHIRVCQVQLDEGLPYVFPADKVWRQSASAASAPAVPIASLAAPTSAHSAALFFPPSAPAAPLYSPLTQLWDSVRAEPFHLGSWQRLLSAVHATHDLVEIREAYRAFLKVFPTSATHWKALVEVELAHRQFAQVEDIFQKVLLKLPEIELWKLYLVYIKVVHTPPPETPAGAAMDDAQHAMNVAIETAYEFVLKHVGQDLHSGQVWKSYVNFMRSIPARSAAEETAKQASLRKIFQRALGIPLQPKELDHIWAEYESYERSVAQHFANKTLSNKLLAEYGAKYAATSAVSKERRKKFQGILAASVGAAYGSKNAVTSSAVHVANRPCHSSPLQQCQDALQLQYWIRFIRFEQFQSPHILKQDSSTFRQRVILAFRQCLLYCRHYPNIWCDFLKFHMDTHSSPEELRAVWKEFREALPYSILPTLIQADMEEEAKHMTEAKALYESLLVAKKQDEPLAEEHSFTLPRPVVEEIRQAKAKADASAAAVKAKEEAAAAGVKDEPKEEAKQSTTAEEDGIVDIYKGELHKVHPVAFILVMRFLRRLEGADSSRKLFLLARKHPDVTYHSFLFAAYSEHHINNDVKIASALYNVGIKKFGADHPAFQEAYLKFLHETNDHQNLRLNYSRLLLTESAENMEKQAHLTKTEKAQMRKAQQAASAAAKEGAAAAAAASAAASGVTIEAEDDPTVDPDDWWAHVNSLLASSVVPSSQPDQQAQRSSWRDRQQEREGSGAGGGGHGPIVLPTRSQLSLWTSYVSFERDSANELSVIQKAEQKRDESLSLRYAHRVVGYIDRWRFRDLWPCSRGLRQTLEKMIRPDQNTLVEWIRIETLKEEAASLPAAVNAAAAASSSSSSSSSSLATLPRPRGVLYTDGAVIASVKSGMVRPDLSKLSAFSASAHALDRAAVRSRYGLIVPDQILNVLSVLPPSNLFQGPFIHPQLILEMLQHIPDAEVTATQQGAGAAAAASSSSSSDGASSRGKGGKGGRGKRKQQEEEEDEEEAAAAAAEANTPANDLYRKRQQLKMAKLNE